MSVLAHVLVGGAAVVAFETAQVLMRGPTLSVFELAVLPLVGALVGGMIGLGEAIGRIRD